MNWPAFAVAALPALHEFQAVAPARCPDLLDGRPAWPGCRVALPAGLALPALPRSGHGAVNQPSLLIGYQFCSCPAGLLTRRA